MRKYTKEHLSAICRGTLPALPGCCFPPGANYLRPYRFSFYKPTVVRRVSKASLQLAAQPVHTLELKYVHGLDLVRERRSECRATAHQLYRVSPSSAPKDPVVIAGHKIKNCSMLGAFRSLPFESWHSSDVNYAIGRALCKNRLCPNCQRVLAAKRRKNAAGFFELNAEKLKRYRFYHLVLTLKHKSAEGVRTGLYTSELLKYYKRLRGADGNRAAAAWWNQRVAGTSYSVELKAAKDGTAHIHMHILVMSKMPLYNHKTPSRSAFITSARERWRAITGDSDGVFLEPVYFLQDERKVYYDPSRDSVTVLQKAIAECMKYTLKADSEALAGFDYSFIRDLLTVRNRYYGRTGVLNAKCAASKQFAELGRLNTDFQDLEELTSNEWRQLFNPETGETYAKEETKISVAFFSNTRKRVAAGASIHHEPDRPRGGEEYYSFKNRSLATFYGYEEKKPVAVHLAKSIRYEYHPENDLLSSTDDI